VQFTDHFFSQFVLHTVIECSQIVFFALLYFHGHIPPPTTSHHLSSAPCLSPLTQAYHAANVQPNKVVLVGAGCAHDDLVKLGEKHFGDWKANTSAAATASKSPAKYLGGQSTTEVCACVCERESFGL
jgi:hypothetical protein